MTTLQQRNNDVMAGIKATAEANAALIVAAPELLEALQYIVLWNRDDWSAEHARDIARKAILRATV